MSSFLTSSFLTGLLAFLASWFLAGCRFGNDVEQAPPPATEEQPYTVNGYYETTFKKLTAKAVHSETVVNEAVSEAKVPSYISGTFTYPSILVLDGSTAWLANYEGKNAYGFSGDESNSTFAGTQSTSEVWQTEWNECQIKTNIIVNGNWTKYSEVKKLPIGVDAKGAVSVSWGELVLFDGDCARTLDAMWACYLDVSKCGFATDAENQAALAYTQEKFNLFVDANVMTPDDIPNLKSLAFDVVYGM